MTDGYKLSQTRGTKMPAHTKVVIRLMEIKNEDIQDNSGSIFFFIMIDERIQTQNQAEQMPSRQAQ